MLRDQLRKTSSSIRAVFQARTRCHARSMTGRERNEMRVGVGTYTVGAATALLEVVWLMFLTWSLTLVFASSMDTLALAATVDLERENLSTPTCFGALWRRIFAAERDIEHASDVAATVSSLRCSRRWKGKDLTRVTWIETRGCFT